MLKKTNAFPKRVGYKFFAEVWAELKHTVTSLADTHLLIKLFMLGPLDKKFDGWVTLQL